LNLSLIASPLDNRGRSREGDSRLVGDMSPIWSIGGGAGVRLPRAPGPERKPFGDDGSVPTVGNPTYPEAADQYRQLGGPAGVPACRRGTPVPDGTPDHAGRHKAAEAGATWTGPYFASDPGGTAGGLVKADTRVSFDNLSSRSAPARRPAGPGLRSVGGCTGSMAVAERVARVSDGLVPRVAACSAWPTAVAGRGPHDEHKFPTSESGQPRPGPSDRRPGRFVEVVPARPGQTSPSERSDPGARGRRSDSYRTARRVKADTSVRFFGQIGRGGAPGSADTPGLVGGEPPGCHSGRSGRLCIDRSTTPRPARRASALRAGRGRGESLGFLLPFSGKGDAPGRGRADGLSAYGRPVVGKNPVRRGSKNRRWLVPVPGTCRRSRHHRLGACPSGLSYHVRPVAR